MSSRGRFTHSVLGLFALASMAAATGWRTRGAYWSWRQETAFGSDRSCWPKPKERRRAVLEYARWVVSMRRLNRR